MDNEIVLSKPVLQDLPLRNTINYFLSWDASFLGQDNIADWWDSWPKFRKKHGWNKFKLKYF